MNGEWKLIGYGFGVATVGAVASMSFIVGVSALYVGKFTIGVWSLVAAGCLAIAFLTSLRPYLNALDRRLSATPSDLAAEKHQ